MRKVLSAACLGAVAAFAAGVAYANDDLNKMAQNPKDWVMPAGDYANTRYSKLNQINASNVGKLQVAWTFSTGVLRGHEGGPLIVGNTMYVHTPFPNKVYALDLSDENKMISGSSTSARDSPARLRIPPEISPGSFFSAPASPVISSFSSTIRLISDSDFLVCSRSGKATLSYRFI